MKTQEIPFTKTQWTKVQRLNKIEAQAKVLSKKIDKNQAQSEVWIKQFDKLGALKNDLNMSLREAISTNAGFFGKTFFEIVKYFNRKAFVRVYANHDEQMASIGKTMTKTPTKTAKPVRKTTKSARTEATASH